MKTVTSTTTEKTTQIVCKALTIDKIDETTDLFEEGLLDSLSLMQLMVELEEGFEINIAPEELDIDDYRSIKSISMMVERLS